VCSMITLNVKMRRKKVVESLNQSVADARPWSLFLLTSSMVVFLIYTKATVAALLVNYLMSALGDIAVNGSGQGKTITGSMAIVARPSKREEISLPSMRCVQHLERHGLEYNKRCESTCSGATRCTASVEDSLRPDVYRTQTAFRLRLQAIACFTVQNKSHAILTATLFFVKGVAIVVPLPSKPVLLDGSPLQGGGSET